MQTLFESISSITVLGMVIFPVTIVAYASNGAEGRLQKNTMLRGAIVMELECGPKHCTRFFVHFGGIVGYKRKMVKIDAKLIVRILKILVIYVF